jgi:long-chain acyl-CoA synthetase
VVSSSARLDPGIKGELLKRFQCHFHECYGTSEIAIATNLDPKDALAHIDSVGRPAAGVDVKILRKDGTLAAIGEIGEIVCATPMLFGGYYQQPEKTSAAMWGDYFRTGDLGRLDGDGFLYYHGRAKELIISGGINIYPTDIEKVVDELEGVVECAAFALPDEQLGEIVALAVVRAPVDSITERQIKRHCASRLADFQQPRRIFIVDRLPRNAMGKLTKHLLSTQFASCVESK